MTNFLYRLSRQWRRFSRTPAVDHIAVDVVVPAWNAEVTITQTLESIASQTHKNFRCWVVDDSSKDNTARLVSQFCQGDDRFAFISSSKQRRVAATRNLGVAQGDAPWVTFCDADDTWTPRKLQSQLRSLLNQDAQAVLSAVTVQYPSVGGYTAGRLIRKSHFSQQDLFARLLSFNMAICGSNLMVNRAVLNLVGGFDPAIDPSDDYDLLLRLAYHQVRLAFDPRPTVNYNRNLGSITQQAVPRTTYYHERCIEQWCKKAGVRDDLHRDWAQKLNKVLFVDPSDTENALLPDCSPKFSTRVYSKDGFF
jgi:glycosyltransferase involved in cell wall biosynthesis